MVAEIGFERDSWVALVDAARKAKGAAFRAGEALPGGEKGRVDGQR